MTKHPPAYKTVSLRSDNKLGRIYWRKFLNKFESNAQRTHCDLKCLHFKSQCASTMI